MPNFFSTIHWKGLSRLQLRCQQGCAPSGSAKGESISLPYLVYLVKIEPAWIIQNDLFSSQSIDYQKLMSSACYISVVK